MSSKTYVFTPPASASTVSNLNLMAMLQADDIPNTTQTVTFNQQTGNISQIVHSRNNAAVRTDTFTFGANTITEVRTLAAGGSLTLVTNLTTLATTVTYSAV